MPLTPIDVCVSNTQLGKWCWWHSDWAMTKCSRWARGDEVGDGAYFLQWYERDKTRNTTLLYGHKYYYYYY